MFRATARMAAHPFTTIDPNVGVAYYAEDCPCKKLHLKHCDGQYLTIFT